MLSEYFWLPEFCSFLASSAAINSLNLFASRIASSMAYSARLTVRLCAALLISAVRERSSTLGLIFGPFADVIPVVDPGLSSETGSPSLLFGASEFFASVFSSRKIIQPFIHSCFEQLVMVDSRTKPASTSRRKVLETSNS